MADNKAPMNYVLGRGELYFAQFIPSTLNPTGERYFGNTPEVSFTIQEDALDHYNSDKGVNEKDASISLTLNRTGSFVTDNISPENLSLFFFGSSAPFVVTGAAVVAEHHDDVSPGLTYQLGITPTNPVGARKLDNNSTGPIVKVLVKNDAGSPVTYVDTTDYVIDMERGRLYIVPGGAIVEGTNLRVGYKTLTSTRQRTISGNTPILGALRYISNAPIGEKEDWYMPYVKITPNGDFNLKGNEFQQIPFNVEVLKKVDAEAFYIDGEPLTS